MYCDARLRLSPWSMLLLIGCSYHSVSLTWFKAFIGFFPLYCAILRHTFSTVSRFQCVLLGGNVLLWLLFKNYFYFVVMARAILSTLILQRPFYTALVFRCLTYNYFSFFFSPWVYMPWVYSNLHILSQAFRLLPYYLILNNIWSTLLFYSVMTLPRPLTGGILFDFVTWGPLCGLRPEILWGWAAPWPFACKPSCWLVYHNYAFGALPLCLSDLHVL